MHRQSFFLVPLICLSSALWAAPATVNVEVLQDKLDHPWALAFLPDNHGMLITLGNDSNLLIVFYVQIMPDDFVMQLHRF